MKRTAAFIAICGMILLTGCGAEDAALAETGIAAGETAGALDDKAGAALNAAAGETDAENSDGTARSLDRNKPEGGQYVFQEMTITLPEDWIGRCVMEESEVGFSIYQKASYEKDDGTGYICGFFRTEEPVEYDHGKTVVAYTEDGTLYYMAEPTDVACDTEDEKIAGEYIRMCQQATLLKSSLQISAPGAHCHADECMLPTSSILPLEETELAGLSDNFLWIAKNEIFARHGRLFDNEYLQQYFNRCTWYRGETAPEEFRESVLNQTEKENLRLLTAALEEYGRQHPYPKRYQASETAAEDLDGDGRAEEISYQVMEQENGEVLCVLTVNGDTFMAGGISDDVTDMKMMNPTFDCFYITDILEDDDKLEIAVLDEGPSDDPVTYFFRYDGGLYCIGAVPGFPFAVPGGGVNGFDGYGGVTGYSQIDLIETAFVQEYWRFDGIRITEAAMGSYDLLPSFGHVLYEDLPVYCEQDETSAGTVIPAQEEVFFLATDRERWILVKGKDGSRGYMLIENGRIVGLDKPAEEVFSGLQFSG